MVVSCRGGGGADRQGRAELSALSVVYSGAPKGYAWRGLCWASRPPGRAPSGSKAHPCCKLCMRSAAQESIRRAFAEEVAQGTAVQCGHARVQAGTTHQLKEDVERPPVPVGRHLGEVHGDRLVSGANAKAQQDAATDKHGEILGRGVQNGAQQEAEAAKGHGPARAQAARANAQGVSTGRALAPQASLHPPAPHALPLAFRAPEVAASGCPLGVPTGAPLPPCPPFSPSFSPPLPLWAPMPPCPPFPYYGVAYRSMPCSPSLSRGALLPGAPKGAGDVAGEGGHAHARQPHGAGEQLEGLVVKGACARRRGGGASLQGLACSGWSLFNCGGRASRAGGCAGRTHSRGCRSSPSAILRRRRGRTSAGNFPCSRRHR